MYNKKTILNQAIKAINTENLFLFADLEAYVSCSKTSLYRYFPLGSKDRELIDELLSKNKIDIKVGLRRKLYKMDTPAAAIALYKLVATPEEQEALSRGGAYMSKPDSSKQITVNKIDISVYKTQVVEALKEDGRYTPSLEAEIYALASARMSLEMINRQLSENSSPTIIEKSSQGIKTVPNPLYDMQRKALDIVSTHTKLLGLEHESVMGTEQGDKLTQVTSQLVELMRNDETIKPQ